MIELVPVLYFKQFNNPGCVKLRYLHLIVSIIVIFCIISIAEESNPVTSEKLSSCISAYREGYYARAISCIEKSLPDLNAHQDSLEAYEMLAQSYGMINQIEKAKMYFGLMLDKDQAIDIDTLAFPPNIALIFNQVKLEKKVSRIESSPFNGSSVIHERKRNPAIPLLLTTVVLSTGGAVYLFYNGYLARDEYSKLGNDQHLLDKKWEEYTYSIAGGIGCSVVSGVATILFFRVINKNEKVSISGMGEGLIMSYDF
jgi:tetratricopeptide (TPR) repeat protein